ncbi:PE family protein, partial [Mycobacterium kansasii]
MSFLRTIPEQLSYAATDLASIGSSISAAGNTAAGPTTALLAAGADDVSAAVAALFGSYGQTYQTVSAQMASLHQQFVQGLVTGS